MRKLLGFLGGLLLVFGIAGMAGATELLVNGDFSNGLSGWETGLIPTDVVLGTNVYANMTGNYALLGKTAKAGISSLYQTFSVSSEATSLAISFNFAISYHDKDGLFTSSSDRFFSLVSDNGPIVAFDNEYLLDFTTTNTGNGYTLYSGTWKEVVDITGWDSLIDPIDYVTILFKLSESAFADTDSYVGIDKVSIDDGLGVATSSATTPEPATMVLFGVGLLGLAGTARKKLIKK